MSSKRMPIYLVISGIFILLTAIDTVAGEPGLASQTAESSTVESAAGGEGTIYGAGVDEIESVSISSIAADPEAYAGKTVRVEGIVTDVCSKKGCWLELAGGQPGATARFKVNDGEMVFPTSAKGKSAVAQGTVVTQHMSLEETRELEAHFARDAGREFDPETITEGKTVFRIRGTGAVISDPSSED